MKFFHLGRNKPFRMIYRFHDPEKEAMEDRERRIKQELGMEVEKRDETYRPNIKGQFRGQRDAKREGFFARKEAKKSNVRVLVIVAILVMIAYYILG